MRWQGLARVAGLVLFVMTLGRESKDVPQFRFRRVRLFCMVLFLCLPGSAQITNVDGPQASPIHGVGHDYIHGLSETVNPAYGQVSVRVNMPTASARGITLPLALQYSSGGILQATPQQPNGGLAWLGSAFHTNAGQPMSPGWTLSLPILTVIMNEYDWTEGDPNDPPYIVHQCFYASNYIFQDPSGVRHSLELQVIGGGRVGDCAGVPFYDNLQAGDDYYSASTSSAPNSLATLPPVTILDRDGSVYSFNNFFTTSPYPGSGNVSVGWGGYPSSIEDRNGNVVHINYSGRDTVVTDTAGRTAIHVSSINTGNNQNTLAISGLSNSYTVQWGNVGFNFSTPAQTVSGCNVGVASGQGSNYAVQTLTLPNGQNYQFQYDGTYGLLQKIIYPTGAWVSYTWGVNALAEYQDYNSTPGGVNGNCNTKVWYGEPAILHRYVSFDGTATAIPEEKNAVSVLVLDQGAWNRLSKDDQQKLIREAGKGFIQLQKNLIDDAVKRAQKLKKDACDATKKNCS